MCYFLYITLYNTPDIIKPFSYCVHNVPKIFGHPGTLPVYKMYNKTESTHNDASDNNVFLGMHKHTWGLVVSV
jgi:hypothetical protein